MALRKIDPEADRAARLAAAKEDINNAATDGPPFEVAVDLDLHLELREWVQAMGIACGVWHDQVPNGEGGYKPECRLVISPLKAPVLDTVVEG